MSSLFKNQSIHITEQGSLAKIKQQMAKAVAASASLDVASVLQQLEQPLRDGQGHLALPVFLFSKTKKQNPKQVALEIANKIKEQKLDFLLDVKALGGFVNFYFTKDYIKKELQKLFSQKELACFSHNNSKPEHLVIDFASPNIAKHMNIGHLRAASIGQALVNLAKQFKYEITTINHLGDWGSQFGKLLWAYREWHTEYDFKNQAFETLVKLYTRFHNEAEQDPKKLKEATGLFQKLEAGDAELHKLWKIFVDLSLKDYDKYWKDLNIKHDLVQGESFYTNLIPDLKSRLQQKNLLKQSQGAEVVFIDEEPSPNKNQTDDNSGKRLDDNSNSGSHSESNSGSRNTSEAKQVGIPPCLITKSDGASTYGARDLCSAIYRFEKLKADQNIYVTGSDQKLHFKQIFKTLEKMGFSWAKNCYHVSFGMYRFKGFGKMSSRGGKAVYLKDLLAEAMQRVTKIIEERRPELQNKNKIAKQVGIGALIFNDLMNDSIKDVDFHWDKVLDFEGRSGPFVQYTLVRCFSLLKKAGVDVDAKDNNSSIIIENFSLSSLEQEELPLAWMLLNFEQAILKSFTNFKPHILARYLLDLSKEFNRFYANERILDSKRSTDRILLVKAVKSVLNKGLEILNVPRPHSM